MGKFAEGIASAALRSHGYVSKLAVGVTKANAGLKPRHPGMPGGVIDTNHPLFVFGHLGLYPSRVLKLVGKDGVSIAAPTAWEGLFKAGAACLDDASGTVYPAWDEVWAHYERATKAALEVVPSIDDAVLLTPTAEERYREFFPTTIMAVTFLLNNHVMMHAGQISAWRRCMGMPSAM